MRTNRKVGVVLFACWLGSSALPVTAQELESEGECGLEVLSLHVPPELATLLGRMAEFARGELITIHFEDVDLRAAIETIARTSGTNVVIAPEVRGRVTATLERIPWREALESVASTCGYAVEELSRPEGVILRIGGR